MIAVVYVFYQREERWQTQKTKSSADCSIYIYLDDFVSIYISCFRLYSFAPTMSTMEKIKLSSSCFPRSELCAPLIRVLNMQGEALSKERQKNIRRVRDYEYAKGLCIINRCMNMISSPLAVWRNNRSPFTTGLENSLLYQSTRQIISSPCPFHCNMMQ